MTGSNGVAANGHINRLADVTPAPAKPWHEWKPLPTDKVDILVVVLTYDKRAGCDILAYTNRLVQMAYANPKVNRLEVAYSYGYPTPRCRNAALKDAKAKGYHFLMMLDDDMRPDMFYGLPGEPDAQPFAETAIDFMMAHDGPCIVGAPYCGEPPHQPVLVMKDRTQYPDMPDVEGQKLDKYTRDEAAILKGIQRVAALPTGHIMIDVRVTEVLDPPWFDYEYDDEPHNTALASTEDVYFTRNLDWLGVPSYCHWSAWAGHHKRFLTGKPRLSPLHNVPAAIHAAFERGWVPPSALAKRTSMTPTQNPVSGALAPVPQPEVCNG